MDCSHHLLGQVVSVWEQSDKEGLQEVVPVCFSGTWAFVVLVLGFPAVGLCGHVAALVLSAVTWLP